MDSGVIELSQTRSGQDSRRFGDGQPFVDDDDDNEMGDDEFQDEIVTLETRETFGWVHSQVKRQHRCSVLSMLVVMSLAAAYVLSGVYTSQVESTLEGDIYDAESGALGNDFDSAKAQDVFEKENGNSNGGNLFGGKGKHTAENPFGNKNAIDHGAMSEQQWEKLHPGKPYPGAKKIGNEKKRDGILGKHDGKNGALGGHAGHKKPICQLEQHQDWLDATVTKDDGIKWEIVDQFSHDKTAFVQGLTFAKGTLWESNGLYGKSTLRILDPDTAEVIQSVNIAPELFAEGMAFWKGMLYQITWKSGRGFIYNATTLEQMKEFSYETTTGQGWGITFDPCNHEFVVTDGSEYLHFWRPKDLQELRKIAVMRMNGKPAKELNEIEWYRGRILANIWHEDVLLVIDPATGTVEKEYDFSGLFPRSERVKLRADVFNGISVSADPDVLYVTGKKWDRMFKIRLLV